jgi:hypothetical protein
MLSLARIRPGKLSLMSSRRHAWLVHPGQGPNPCGPLTSEQPADDSARFAAGARDWIETHRQKLPESLSISPLTSSGNSTRTAGLCEGSTRKYSGCDCQESAPVETTSGGARSQQCFLKRPLQEVAVVHPARDRGRCSQRNLASTASPEVADSSAHDYQKEAVAAGPTAPIRPYEVEQRLRDDVVRILPADPILPPGQPSRISDDGF